MLQTDQGEFETLAALRGAFLRAHGGKPDVQKYFNTDEWNDDTLHVSQLGKCARQQMYRLLGTTKKPRSQAKEDNDELMFWQANMIHAVTAGACDWAGILVACEASLPNLPDGWSGHYDVIFHDRQADWNFLWDGKTVRPNAFDYWYEWPKPEVVAQVRGYLCFVTDEADEGLAEYIDRGGSNTPKTYAIERDDVWVQMRMADLAIYRGLLPELPPMLPREYKLTYRKLNNLPIHKPANIWFKPSWQCEWCDYCYPGACEPIMEKIQVAKHEKGSLVLLEKAHEHGVHAFLESALLEYTDEE